MIKKIIITATILTLLFIGNAGADSVGILPLSEPISATVGIDAYDSIGLSAAYAEMSDGSIYSVVIRRGDDDPSGAIVYSQPNADGSQGPLPATPFYIQEVHWTPSDSSTYTIYATGASGPGKRKITAQAPIIPSPEAGTMILTTTGMLGLIGIVRLRRRD